VTEAAVFAIYADIAALFKQAAVPFDLGSAHRIDNAFHKLGSVVHRPALIATHSSAAMHLGICSAFAFGHRCFRRYVSKPSHREFH